MTELALYRFIQENDIEYNIFADENPFKINKVYAFIPIYLIQEFVDLFKKSLLLIDNPLECNLKEFYLCIELIQICDHFDIEPENIFKQKENDSRTSINRRE